jgi:hypothetical protein
MSSLARTLTVAKTSRRFRFDAAEFDLSPMELFFMRLGFAVLIFFTIKWETSNLTTVKPEDAVGLAKVLDLTFLGHIKHMVVWQILTVIGLATYVAGRLPVLGLVPALFFAIGIGTLNASQGAHNHSTQLCSMILLGQFLVYALPWLPGRGFRKTSWLVPDADIHRRAIYVSMVIFAASYVVSGWVKLQNSDWLWFYKVVPGLAMELQKTNWSAYYDTLAPVPQVFTTTLNLMNEHPLLGRVFFGAGLLIELLAFVMLMGRRWAFFTGLAIIAMHLSISSLMQLDFWYHIWAAVIFLLNLPGLALTFTRRAGSGAGLFLTGR